MKKLTLRSTLTAAAVLLAGASVSRSQVMPGDTFSYDLVGGNTGTPATAYYLTGPATATFDSLTPGTTTGPDGQVISIMSSETFGPGTTTDTFTLSTPTNFFGEANIAGPGTTLINALAFDIGDANSGSNPVNLLLPLETYSATGSIIDGTNHTDVIGTNTTAPAGTTSYFASLGVNTGDPSTPIDTFTVHSITYSITYTSGVPEPSTWAMLGLGGIVAAIAMRRRRRISA